MMIEVDIGAMTSGRAGGRAVQIKYFFFSMAGHGAALAGSTGLAGGQ